MLSKKKGNKLGLFGGRDTFRVERVLQCFFHPQLLMGLTLGMIQVGVYGTMKQSKRRKSMDKE